jgi:metal-sulfur cluster biosynthetic enzyme
MAAGTDRRAPTIAAIRRALDTIGDPCSVAQGVPMGLDEMGLVERVDLDDEGHATIALRLTSPTCFMVGYFDVEARDRALAVPGVRSVTITTDRGVRWTSAMISPAARQRRRRAMLARGMPAAVAERATAGADRGP